MDNRACVTMKGSTFLSYLHRSHILRRFKFFCLQLMFCSIVAKMEDMVCASFTYNGGCGYCCRGPGKTSCQAAFWLTGCRQEPSVLQNFAGDKHCLLWYFTNSPKTPIDILQVSGFQVHLLRATFPLHLLQ